jgi:hypothetical protein|tara:strand:- start:47 stop:298 length:252 start_codon:yes stop_codon:yes gene_type:complete
MSRYNSRMHGVKTDNLYVDISWGFDHVLGYWYDIIETKDGEETIIEEWSTKLNGGSRGKMLEFLIKYNLSEEHRSMVALDMEF